MFESMRRVFGPVVVSVIIAAIALVFVFYGVYNPRSTSGVSAGALAATVNGDAVTLQEFMREYQGRVEFYQNLMKGNADPNALKQMGLHGQVLEELIRRKLILQEAVRMGVGVADDEVREKIQEMPYFKKEGKFDAGHYARVLEANRHSPAGFEEIVREDVLRSKAVDFIRGRARVSEKEVEKEFLVTQNRRQVEFVVLSRDSAKKRMMVSEKEIQDLLKTEPGLNAAKTHYEQSKMRYMKTASLVADTAKKLKSAGAELAVDMPKPEFHFFEEVKTKVVADLIKERRSEEIAKINRELSVEVAAKAKGSSPGAFKAYLKEKGLELKESEPFHRLQRGVTGLGEQPELIEDAFASSSPLAQGAKAYENRGTIVVARGLRSFEPKMADFAKDKEKLAGQVAARKEQALLDGWVSDLRARAKVSVNETVERGELAGGE